MNKKENRDAELIIGEIVAAKIKVKGHREESVRPVVVMKEEKCPEHSSTLIVFPISSAGSNAYLPKRLFLPAEESGLPINSWVLCEAAYCVQQKDIGRKVGSVPDEYLSILLKKVVGNE